MLSLAMFPIRDITKKELQETVIRQIREKKDGSINELLRNSYLDNYRSAVSGVLGKAKYGEGEFELIMKAQNNVERLANFKAYHATLELKLLDTNHPDFERNAKAVINTFNKYQVTEYNTLTARARTAHQWNGFKDTADLYPNLQWLPSRSADPREAHKAYYYRIWSMDDPFWDKNQPGSLWGCKCDWKQTDSPITDNTDVVVVPASRGLEGNPGKEGVLVTDRHSYISSVKDTVKDSISSDIMKDIRKRSIKDACESLRGKKVLKVLDDRKISVEISRASIQHFCNDWAKDQATYNVKNSMAPFMDKMLGEAKFVKTVPEGKGNPEVKQYHYFSFEMLGEMMYLNVRELANGKNFLYALSATMR